MASTFAWLDHSEEQRRRVLDVIDLFKEQGTVDELGLGTIRDAMADVLFPGTSNLMTRASYYLFVPWMYQRLEQQKVASAEIAAKARREELKLIERLLGSGETEGVIGRRARGSLRRLPSSIYWAGLKRLGICLFDGSQDSYHRSLDRFYQRRQRSVRTDDGETVGGGRLNWHPRIPAPPSDWPVDTKLAMDKTQAEFMCDQVSLQTPTSLFAFLIRRDRVARHVEYPWAHPLHAEFTDVIRWQLKHAQNMSEVMHGAPLLYNLWLSELTGQPDLEDDYRQRFDQWAQMVSDRFGQLKEWDRADAWRCFESEGGRIPRPTKEFVEAWSQLTLEGHPANLATDQRARLLIKNREKRLKGPLSRIENDRPRELWQGASSTRRLQYRWSNAAVVIEDVVTVLHGGASA
jgi:hypothetical protein